MLGLGYIFGSFDCAVGFLGGIQAPKSEEKAEALFACSTTNLPSHLFLPTTFQKVDNASTPCVSLEILFTG